MIITEKILKSLLKDEAPNKSSQITTLYINNNIVNNFNIKSPFRNIEFLSLRNNCVSQINFVTNFPNLWYLDLRNNPIESYENINQFNVLGFLGLSVDKYSEKKVLCLRKLNIGILELEVDETTQKQFLMNNPNVIKCNEEVLYYHEKTEKHKDLLGKNNLMSLSSNHKTVFSNYIKTDINSPNANMLITFFEHFNTEVNSLNNSENINSSVVYLNMERTKLIILSKIFESLNKLNSNSNCVLKLSKENLNKLTFSPKGVNKVPNEENQSLYMKSLLDFSNFKVKNVPSQIMILAVILLYILNLLGTEIAILLLEFVFKHMIKLDVSANELKSFLELECDYLLGFYFDVYDNLVTEYKGEVGLSIISAFDYDGRLSPPDRKYEEVVKSLQMSKLILQSNLLKSFKLEATKLYNAKNDFESRRTKINVTFIGLLEKLTIFDDTLGLLQYVNDFILFNKLDSKMVKEFTFQYRIFIEFKELMFTHLSKKSNSNYTLFDRQYSDMKYRRFGNKLFFINYPLSTSHKESNKIFEKENKPKPKYNKEPSYELTISNRKEKRRFVKMNISFESEKEIQQSFKNKKKDKIQFDSSLKVSTFDNPTNDISEDKKPKMSNHVKHSSLVSSEADGIKLDLDTLLKTTKLEFAKRKKKFTKSLKNIDSSRSENLIKPSVVSYSKIFSANKSQIIQNNNLSKLNTKFTPKTQNQKFKELNNIRQIKSNKIDKTNRQDKIEPLQIENSEMIEKTLNTVEGGVNTGNQKMIFSGYNSPKNLPPLKKTVYNFNYNIKKLTHHWNENNPHAKNKNGDVKENEIQKMIKGKKQNPSPENYMTADDIYNLFAIENKNEAVKSKY